MSFSTTGSVFAKRAPRKQTLSVLLCGASGTGKSSFINTLVGKRVLFDSEQYSLPAQTHSPLRFTPSTVELDQPLSDGSRLVLTLIETEGFGVNINHGLDIDQVAGFIECRFDEVLAEESRIRRNPRFKDNRIDACLYFIDPTGHGLRELDVLTMKRLSSIVNVIPVMARSDTLTPSEKVANKRLIAEDLRFHDIEVFDFHFSEEAAGSAAGNAAADDEEVEEEENDLYSSIPFAVSSTSEFNADGEALYRRILPFGAVDILNPQHTDFKVLREAILDRYLFELKDRTHDVLYETFRTHRLDPQQNHRASLLMPQELADHAARLKQAQIDRETALLREEERRVNAEIEAKRAMLLKRERELRDLEMRMALKPARGSSAPNSQPSSAASTSFPSDQIPFDRTENQSSRGSAVQHAQQHAQQQSQQQHVSADLSQPMSQIHVSQEAMAQNPYFPTAVEQGSAMEVGAQPRADDGYVDYEVPEDEPLDAEAAQLRVRQVRSKKELRQHADQLHAELGDLEEQRKSIQRQVVASSTTRSVHSQLTTRDQSSASLAHHIDSMQSDVDAPLLPPASNNSNSAVNANTSPLNIKKTAAA